MYILQEYDLRIDGLPFSQQITQYFSKENGLLTEGSLKSLEQNQETSARRVILDHPTLLLRNKLGKSPTQLSLVLKQGPSMTLDVPRIASSWAQNTRTHRLLRSFPSLLLGFIYKDPPASQQEQDKSHLPYPLHVRIIIRINQPSIQYFSPAESDPLQ